MSDAGKDLEQLEHSRNAGGKTVGQFLIKLNITIKPYNKYSPIPKWNTDSYSHKKCLKQADFVNCQKLETSQKSIS